MHPTFEAKQHKSWQDTSRNIWSNIIAPFQHPLGPSCYLWTLVNYYSNYWPNDWDSHADIIIAWICHLVSQRPPQLPCQNSPSSPHFMCLPSLKAKPLAIFRQPLPMTSRSSSSHHPRLISGPNPPTTSLTMRLPAWYLLPSISTNFIQHVSPSVRIGTHCMIKVAWYCLFPMRIVRFGWKQESRFLGGNRL